MEQHLRITNKQSTNIEEIIQNELTILPSKPLPLFTASISLSLSTIFPAPLHLLPKHSPSASLPPNKLKIPSQIFSLSNISICSTFSPPKPSFKSTISSSPFQTPLIRGPRRSSDPSYPAGIRRCSIVWFRNDLRIHDNECLNSANNESISVLPVYCFDPRDYGKSSSGFSKIGSQRATFLIQSVSNLRENLQSRGSNLVVRIGKPESVMAELAKEVGADGLFVQREVSSDDVQTEEKIEAAMNKEGVEVKYFWGSTLHHIEELPFNIEEMPSNYDSFKEKVKTSEIRKTIEGLDQLKGIPARGGVEPGEVPTLLDLGLRPNSAISQDGELTANDFLLGGETEALQRLKNFAAERWAKPNNAHNDGSKDGTSDANFSYKISPWLATGCLSPRFMFDEIKKSTTKNGATDSSSSQMNKMMFELLWRDFFRFITKKCSSMKKSIESNPVTVSVGALALA
ncbi:Cryptochrome dash [Thalictrum thalictroides]|uniref:Cryptochrome dash n=1 Tax=Thalictrum thalictroides TaxID=46969 RepID=A0A7J6VA81_THATH|nr:Cryptochrome dash [Thalictrum thalictroides]